MILGKRHKRQNMAVFVDAPNIIRKEFAIDLNAMTETIQNLGNIKIAKAFLNQFASKKLIEALVSQGFEASFGLGEKDAESDVDVYMAVHAMEAIHNDTIDTLVLVTRDADFLPVVYRAKSRGMTVIIVGTEPGFSTALKNAADKYIVLNG